MHDILAMELWKQLLLFIPVAVVLIICAVTDWRERKVYNKITYPFAAIGLVLHTVTMGFDGTLDGLMALLAAFVIGLIMLPFGWLGGGDTKLLMGLGATLGVHALVVTVFYSIWIGAILGLGMAAYNGYLWEMIKRMGRYLRGWYRVFVYKQAFLKEKLERDERNKVPFAVAILGGVATTYTEFALAWPGFWTWYVSSLGFNP
ncbi:prepilin peptidase [Microvenator marinus]|uniref:Prepilin peptidase n=1 Tax=Microvenator marinus TaxID=2600177 RepID=A0A5B8XUT4_9DELT|nr:A24 family peptidase [Microvenator marinus]QED27843.1 prepilin peptidase [Microvenator marinus]